MKRRKRPRHRASQPARRAGAGASEHEAATVRQKPTPAATQEPPHRHAVLERLSPSKEQLAAALVLAATIWIAHFAQFLHFGLYEDDYAFIGSPMGWTSEQVINRALRYFQTWPQGRPIGFSAVCVMASLGNWIGGLRCIYLIAFALHATNAFILYKIVRRSLSPVAALCSALAFSLFPSNTSTPLLTNALFCGITLFFLLVAIWLYLTGRRAAAYVVSVGSLLTYENAFLPFFAAPLLVTRPLAHLRRELLKHWAILLMIGGSVFWFRLHIGEAKTSEVSNDGLYATLEKVATAMYTGPLTTLRLFFMRPVTVWQEGNREVFLVVIVTAIGLTLALCFFRVHLCDTLQAWPLSFRTRWFQFQASLTIDKSSAAALRLAGCGLVMLCLAYGLAITRVYFPPVIEAGRTTFVHLAAAVGSGLLCGGICSILLEFGETHHKKILAVLVIATYFGGLAGFHYFVQQDFRKSWSLQRVFWNSVLEKCPDLTDGTIIVWEAEYLPSRYARVSSWADPIVLGEIYDFPKSWKKPPRLFHVSKTWMADVTPLGEDLVWQVPGGPWPPREILPKRNVILLRGTPGSDLKRVTGTIEIKSREFPLKPLGKAVLSTYRQGALYDLFLQR